VWTSCFAISFSHPLSPVDTATPVLRDGTRMVAATRMSGDRVRLDWGDGRVAVAGFGAFAIARLPDGGHPELEVVRPLMPSASLYLVRSKRAGEDGLALATRLGTSLDILPDLAFKRTLTFTPPADDPRRGGQWYLDVIGIDNAWASSVGDPSVVIGVVDNGCETEHPDLSANMLGGLDLVDNDDAPNPAPGANNEHGTACAGIIAAEGDNGIGIAGVCPTCRLRCVRLLPDDGSLVALSADINAFAAQLEWNVAVSSNSWGFVDRFPVPVLLRMAIEDLMTKSRDGRGAVVVFAAGNDHREIFDDELYGIPGLVTVGAINAFDEAAQFSNYGSVVDLVAPTGSLTTDTTGASGAGDGDYMSLFGGTSAACPVVAGVAGLMAAAAPDKTGAELADALVRSVRPAPFAVPDEDGHDDQYGFGIVDPGAALARVMPEPEPEPEVEASPEEAVEPGPEPDDVSAEAEAEKERRAEGGGCGAGPMPWWLWGLCGLGLIRRRSR
jgi:subtilisin family serine protease